LQLLLRVLLEEWGCSQQCKDLLSKGFCEAILEEVCVALI
jgi:hypothetical protein